ncbi:hypothetical protein BO70DRAFT_422305 [Aspergillus heteromorphus CBS 117.55]|uniref:Uncharacterized protein n=1 Tax=Aspergillus heteromorphus CBS 117.55 TaxID=1448321 RepID=A0A317WJT8_9EURO|nr:uncharacterized protein BO70DRAFT_422305 [Aspergillus heteromorphus CBS 117.55]PWY86706.1 hypothetical protein BO70DRAFT_422305 [Aspergillus heteromorphus CBS 117.55]
MSLQRTWGRVVGALRGSSHADSGEADVVLEKLETCYNVLLKAETGPIPPDVLCQLPVSLSMVSRESMACANNIKFFVPWSEEALERHPRNLAPGPENVRLSRTEKILKDGSQYFIGIGAWHTYRWASHMSSRLVEEVDIAPRMGTEDNRRPLKSLTGWRHSEAIPDEPTLPQPWFYKRDSYDWHPDFYWTLRGNTYPHIKITMHHGVDGVDGVLLREELLVIIVVMISRLESENFRQHVIVPIMMFSFMGTRHGRILLAHCTQDGLVIEMSALYPFLVGEEDWCSSLALFTRFLAAGPSRADTTRLPASVDLA